MTAVALPPACRGARRNGRDAIGAKSSKREGPWGAMGETHFFSKIKTSLHAAQFRRLFAIQFPSARYKGTW